MTSARTPDGSTALSRRGSDRSIPLAAAFALIVILAGTLLACGVTGGDTGSPDGAVVRIHSVGDGIVLDPASVPAGTVHLESSSPGIVLIAASSGELEGEMEPLDEVALARLERGDFQDTLTQGTEGAFGGPRYTVELPAGHYAFAIMPIDHQQDVAPVAMAVLSVEAPPLPSTGPDETTKPD